MAELEEEQPTAGFGMEDSLAEFEVAQAVEIVEQTTILEYIQDEAYVESNRRFIRL